MNKFVILSFAVLGWAFYELSGGADFEPPQRPESADPVVAQAEPAHSRPASRTRLAVRTETPTLTRRNPAPAAPAQAPAPVEPEAVAEERIQIRFGPQPLPPADPNNPGMLVSLEQSKTQFATPLATFDPNAIPEDEPAPERVAAVAAAPAPDLREIRGTRVNMRDGPGTIYPVISRLRLGQEIEVLSDSGTGWLRVRVLPQQTLGWVAASLVTKRAP